MIWVGIEQGFDNGALGGTVHFADVVGVGFLGDGKVIEIVGSTVDQIAGATRGFNRDVEHGMHGNLTFFNEQLRILVGIAF